MEVDILPEKELEKEKIIPRKDDWMDWTSKIPSLQRTRQQEPEPIPVCPVEFGNQPSSLPPCSTPVDNTSHQYWSSPCTFNLPLPPPPSRSLSQPPPLPSWQPLRIPHPSLPSQAFINPQPLPLPHPPMSLSEHIQTSLFNFAAIPHPINDPPPSKAPTPRIEMAPVSTPPSLMSLKIQAPPGSQELQSEPHKSIRTQEDNRNVRMRETSDSATSSIAEESPCWNCKRPGHRYSECPYQRNRKFCFRCGRDNVDVHTCYHCQEKSSLRTQPQSRNQSERNEEQQRSSTIKLEAENRAVRQQVSTRANDADVQNSTSTPVLIIMPGATVHLNNSRPS